MADKDRGKAVMDRAGDSLILRNAKIAKLARSVREMHAEEEREIAAARQALASAGRAAQEIEGAQGSVLLQCIDAVQHVVTALDRRRQGRVTVDLSVLEHTLGHAETAARNRRSKRIRSSIEQDRKNRIKFTNARALVTDSQSADVQVGEHRETLGGAAGLEAARTRGRERTAEILDGPDMMSADAFAQVLGVSRQTVHNRRQKGEILGLRGARRDYRFPRWQMTEDGGLLPGLPRLLERCGGNAWQAYRFLISSHPELGHGELGQLRAVDALKAGRVEDVLAVADGISQGVYG